MDSILLCFKEHESLNAIVATVAIVLLSDVFAETWNP